jgi:hypothetical protein
LDIGGEDDGAAGSSVDAVGVEVPVLEPDPGGEVCVEVEFTPEMEPFLLPEDDAAAAGMIPAPIEASVPTDMPGVPAAPAALAEPAAAGAGARGAWTGAICADAALVTQSSAARLPAITVLVVQRRTLAACPNEDMLLFWLYKIPPPSSRFIKFSLC